MDRSGWSPSAGRHGDLCGPLRQRVLAKRSLLTRPTVGDLLSNLDRMPCPDTRIAWRSKWRNSGCNGGQRCATPYMWSCFDSLRAHVILRRFPTEIKRKKSTFLSMTGQGWSRLFLDLAWPALWRIFVWCTASTLQPPGTTSRFVASSESAPKESTQLPVTTSNRFHIKLANHEPTRMWSE